MPLTGRNGSEIPEAAAFTCQVNCTDPFPPDEFLAETVAWYVPAVTGTPLMSP